MTARLGFDHATPIGWGAGRHQPNREESLEIISKSSWKWLVVCEGTKLVFRMFNALCCRARWLPLVKLPATKVL